MEKISFSTFFGRANIGTQQTHSAWGGLVWTRSVRTVQGAQGPTRVAPLELHVGAQTGLGMAYSDRAMLPNIFLYIHKSILKIP